jgi:HEAT repeat protein
MNEDTPELEALIRSLTDANKKVVREAAEALISRARQQPELTHRLDELLTTAPREQCWPIAYILGHTGSPSLRCLHVLQETLDNRDPDLRWAAGSLLARLGKLDNRISELLCGLLKTGTPTQRRMAVYGLRDIEPKEDAILHALLSAVEDADALVRVAAVLSLELQSDIPETVLDSLLDLFLNDPDTRVRCATSFALAALGRSSEKISAALNAAVKGEDPQLRRAAEAALESLKKKEPPSPK